METTALYVEYIVVGMETISWIILSLIIIVGDSFNNIIKFTISNIFPSIILIVICYIFGLITDRIADLIFENRRKAIKKKYNLKSQTSIVIWEEYSNTSYANFTLSRIRILRSTILNSILIGLLGAYLAYKKVNIYLAVFAFILFTGVFLCSNSAHKKLLDNFYRKTSALENEAKRHSPIDKKHTV